MVTALEVGKRVVLTAALPVFDPRNPKPSAPHPKPQTSNPEP